METIKDLTVSFLVLVLATLIIVYRVILGVFAIAFLVLLSPVLLAFWMMGKLKIVKVRK